MFGSNLTGLHTHYCETQTARHAWQAHLVVVIALVRAAVGATKAVEEVHDSTMAATTHSPARKEDMASSRRKVR